MFMDCKINTPKMSILPQLTYRFTTIPIKFSASYFVDIDKLILKFIQKGKRPRIVSTILKEKNKVRELTPPDFKTDYKVSHQKSVILEKE